MTGKPFPHTQAFAEAAGFHGCRSAACLSFLRDAAPSSGILWTQKLILPLVGREPWSMNASLFFFFFFFFFTPRVGI